MGFMKIRVRGDYILWSKGHPISHLDGEVDVPEEVVASQYWKVDIVDEDSEVESKSLDSEEVVNRAITEAPKKRSYHKSLK